MDTFRDIVPAILTTKKKLDSEEGFEKAYNKFLTNRALSFHMDCILQANQMNMTPGLDPKLQFDYLLTSIRGYKRPYQKWQKKDVVENLEAVKKFYNYSSDKAKNALEILSDEQIRIIKETIDPGGVKKSK